MKNGDEKSFRFPRSEFEEKKHNICGKEDDFSLVVSITSKSIRKQGS